MNASQLQAWAGFNPGCSGPVEILGIQESSQVDQWRCQLGGWKGDPLCNRALDHGSCFVTCNGMSKVHFSAPCLQQMDVTV